MQIERDIFVNTKLQRLSLRKYSRCKQLSKNLDKLLKLDKEQKKTLIILISISYYINPLILLTTLTISLSLSLSLSLSRSTSCSQALKIFTTTTGSLHQNYFLLYYFVAFDLTLCFTGFDSLISLISDCY